MGCDCLGVWGTTGDSQDVTSAPGARGAPRVHHCFGRADLWRTSADIENDGTVFLSFCRGFSFPRIARCRSTFGGGFRFRPAFCRIGSAHLSSDSRRSRPAGRNRPGRSSGLCTAHAAVSNRHLRKRSVRDPSGAAGCFCEVDLNRA